MTKYEDEIKHDNIFKLLSNKKLKNVSGWEDTYEDSQTLKFEFEEGLTLRIDAYTLSYMLYKNGKVVI